MFHTAHNQAVTSVVCMRSKHRKADRLKLVFKLSTGPFVAVMHELQGLRKQNQSAASQLVELLITHASGLKEVFFCLFVCLSPPQHKNVLDAALSAVFCISNQTRTNQSFGDAEVTFGIHSKSPEFH